MNNSDKEWLKRARSFDMGPCPLQDIPRTIEARHLEDGTIMWVLKLGEYLLGKDGEYHHEEENLSNEGFIQNTRFQTPQGIVEFWKYLVSDEEDTNDDSNSAEMIRNAQNLLDGYSSLM